MSDKFTAQDYQAVRQYWTGNLESVVVHYETQLPRRSTRQQAISDGFRTWGHDDFNIAVWEGAELVSWDWMDEQIEDDLQAIAHAIRSGRGLAL